MTFVPLRLGVLGCADIVRRRAMPAVGPMSEVEVVALASRDPAKAEKFAGEFGGEPVAGYENLLARSDVEAVYIALPAALHHAWARRALLAGKHVLVEKPAVLRREEAGELVAVAAARGLRLLENFAFLHHPRHAVARGLVAEGAIGDLRGFRAAFGFPPRDPDDIRYRPELGGGALTDAGVYLVRAARHFLGDDLAVVGSWLESGPGVGVDLGGAALLVSGGGVPAHLSFSFHAAYRSEYELWGTRGRIVVERAYAVPADLATCVVLERDGDRREIPVPAADQFAAQFRHFARSVRSAGPVADGTGRDLLAQAELVERIGRAAGPLSR